MIRKDMRYDTRTVKHRLRRGEYAPADLDSHLSELPDEAEEFEETTVQFSRSFEERHYAAATETDEKKSD
ncbi:MAG: hypothetical protein KTR31_12315 [Myxococcales bacterium]|nr:hypothetical protein [Myxococcales bacterium]